VYVFEKTGGSWSQQAKLSADDGDENDLFGGAVALSNDGTTTIVGAYGDEDPNGDESVNGDTAGSVYAFEKSDGSWSQQTKLAADNGNPNDGFGNSLAVSDDGTTAVIGVPGDEDSNGDTVGSVYVCQKSGDS
jgi:hypothetical protein